MGKRLIIILFVLFFSLSTNFTYAQSYNMSYLYFGDQNDYLQAVNKASNTLNMVSPSYFDLNKDGTLKDKVDRFFVEEMHKDGIKVVPFLSNHWDREAGRNALKTEELLAGQIAELVSKYNLDGIHLDIENLTEIDRDKYTKFVQLLRDQIPKEKEVSIAVAVNPFEINFGWQGSYDYSALAQYADYLMLMAYDETYYGSESGPGASIDFVEKSIQVALKYVPSEKLVLGIPFYGRYWSINGSGGYGVSIDTVEKLIMKYGGRTYYDEKNESPSAILTFPKGNEPIIHGRKVPAGTYIFWYENDMSLKAKLKLVAKYNLRGTGSWSLTEAPDNIWNYYLAWVNGEHYFVDTDGHWAENDILAVLEKGWMIGLNEFHFAPDTALTRAQATVILVRALGLKPIAEQNLIFNDVPANYWAREEITIAWQNGIIKGFNNYSFQPDATLTREQMAVLLERVIGKDEEFVNASNLEEKSYIDVLPTDWSYSAIMSIAKRNIFKGITDEVFKPKDILSRGQMAALMNRINTYLP